jgi:hypothetical protein
MDSESEEEKNDDDKIIDTGTGDVLIAIDLGAINSSCTIVDVKTEKILRWFLIPVVESSKTTYELICTNLLKSLNDLDPLKNTSSVPRSVIVVVEQQPKINIRTLVMSGQVQMYFVIKKENARLNPELYKGQYKIKKIIGYHAGNKLKYYEPMPGDPPIITKAKNTHPRNKAIGKQQCAIILKNKGEHEFLEFYTKQKKKDDLADSYLMALAYIKFEIKKECAGVKQVLNYIQSVSGPGITAVSNPSVSKSKIKAITAVYPVPPGDLLNTSGTSDFSGAIAPVQKKNTYYNRLKKRYHKKVNVINPLKPGDEIPGKPDYIMGQHGRPVKKDGKAAKEIYQGIIRK